MRPLAKCLPLIAAGLPAVAGWCGCRPGNSENDRPLVVLVSGDTDGWIVPCGCASNQSGGLPRRGTLVKQLRRDADLILLDAGGAPAGTSPYDRVRFEAILQGEVAMGLAAHNVGASEAALGPDYLRRLAQGPDLPLVSANVRDLDGRPVAEPLRIVEAAGRRMAVVGVLGETFATEQLRVTPPRRAVLDALKQAAGRYDAVVVLAYLPEDQLRQLAVTLPEADAVVGGPTGQPIPPTPIGPTLLASATNKGKFVVRLDVPGPGRRWTGRIVELTEKLADDPDQVANLKQFYQQLARRDFPPDQTDFAQPLLSSPPDYRIAGTETCRECHPGDCRLWDLSKHARAWDSLRKKGAHVDPQCQRCHVTGYGAPGGFASVKRTPGLVHIGCESCHGPSQAHLGDPKTRTTPFAAARDRCTDCHDREHSPEFAYDKYWTRIRHGEPAVAPSQPAVVSGTTNEDRR